MATENTMCRPMNASSSDVVTSVQFLADYFLAYSFVSWTIRRMRSKGKNFLKSQIRLLPSVTRSYIQARRRQTGDREFPLILQSMLFHLLLNRHKLLTVDTLETLDTSEQIPMSTLT